MQPRDLASHEEYVAGRGIEEVARELGRDPAEFVKLASNENLLGPSPAAVEAIREFADEVHHYPKAVHADLVAALADRWGVGDEQIWLANGGDGALDYLGRAMLDPGDEVLVPEPGFAYYGMSARFHHGEVNTYPVSQADDFALSPANVFETYDGERIVYLTSPHNPTGSRFTIEDVETIAAGTDDETLVVVDEAYAEFTDAPSAVDLLDDRDDVAVLRTFSKAYGLAGLRLGYAIVPDAWADAYAKVNTPFAASAVACTAGLAALEDGDHVEKTTELVRWARAYMKDKIEAKTYESHGNFVLVEVGDGSAVSETLKRRGIIVRDCSSFGLDDHVRVTCGTKRETKRAVSELNEVLGE